MNELDRLDDDIAALVRERHDPAPPADAQARVATRLSATLGAAALAPSSVAASKFALAKSVGALGAALAIGAGLGSAITYAVMRAEPRVEISALPTSIAIADAGAPIETDAALPVPDAGAARIEAPRPIERDSSEGPSDAAERNLVERARSAMARGRFAQALQALEAHRARFEDGRFAEEREALAISALANLGRRDEAAARADRFRARYPRSLFRASIDRALER